MTKRKKHRLSRPKPSLGLLRAREARVIALKKTGMAVGDIANMPEAANDALLLEVIDRVSEVRVRVEEQARPRRAVQA